MYPSEIGSKFVTGPEKFVLHLVMDQFHPSSLDVRNVPIFSLIFLETICIARIEMAPEQWIYASIMNMVSLQSHAKYMFILSLWPT